MPYCKHCEEYVSYDETIHDCEKRGLLDVSKDDSFLVSALIGYATGSALLGGILGGDLLGGALGDIAEGGGLMDFDDDDF